MRLLVYGAGVLGSLYAARLARAGHSVTVLARNERLEQIRRHGIILVDEGAGRETATHVHTTALLTPDDDYEAVLVAVRKDQLPDVLPSLSVNRKIPTFLFFCNNAAGPGDLIAAVGEERVLLGFPGAGGAREGELILTHTVSGKLQPTTIGELNGQVTDRLRSLAGALLNAGFPVALEPRMDAWLKTHVALVSPLANAMYYAGDNYRLAGSPEGLQLAVAAVKEGFRVLDRLAIPITPARLRLLQRTPDWLLKPVLRRTLNSRKAELVFWRHANVARPEMRLLAAEFQELIKKAGIAAPAVDTLCRYNN